MASAVVERRTQPDGCAVVELRGELDMGCEAALRHMLVDMPREAPSGIVVNMRHVSFIDSTGVGALVAGLKAARSAGIPFRVGQVAPFVERHLRIMGLYEILAGNADAGNADAATADAGNADAAKADAGNADAAKADAGNADAGNAGGGSALAR